jgi:DNA end-binding protein Ku
MLIPAKGYKATDTDKIEANMYHSADCMSRLQQKYTCIGCGTEVPNALSTAVRGYTVGDKIVTISKAELEAQAPANDKVLKITGFVPADSVDVTYYESSEYLAADKGGEKAFATFQQGLAESNRVAIGTLVSRNHQYTVAIRPKGQHGLVMSYLFAEYEVRDCGKWQAVPTNREEVELVKQLMTETELAQDKFEAAAYDPYLANVRKLIGDKAKGCTVSTPDVEATPKAGTDDIMDALKAMLEQQKAKKATAGK